HFDGSAARSAGFEAVQFQLEPIAAAFDFERRVTTETTVLVVDIGGGTSDFSVIRVGPQRMSHADRSRDVLASAGTHIGGTDFDQLLSLRHVMPLLGLGHLGPGGREVPSSVFFNLSTWHLIHALYSRKSLHAARELKSLFADAALHTRLMRALSHREGHRILSHVEAAKITCSSLNAPSEIDLGCIERGLAALLTPAGLSQVLQQKVAQIVRCARQCVTDSGLRAVDAVYLTGGSSALTPLGVALQAMFSSASIVRGDRFGSVAAGLATSGWASSRELRQLLNT
ncbi:MAG: Hsp70 family protein, partial [Rhodoferax sp.]